MRLAHGGVDDLEDTDAEGGGLSCSGLGLGDGVATLADLDNGSRLHSGRRLVSVGVDAAKQVFLEVHGLEGGRDGDLLGGGELHALLRLAIDCVVGHDGQLCV